MRLLLDECVPRHLKHDFEDYEVLTANEAGFKGLKNGKLLEAAALDFDVLITVDRNIEHQQNVNEVELAIIVLAANSNRYKVLSRLTEQAISSMQNIAQGQVITIEQEETNW